MAVVVKVPPKQIDKTGDITNSLLSLQFESALSDSEKDVLYLRKWSHAHTVTACAQATYYVTVLNEARQICGQLKQPAGRRATRLLQDSSTAKDGIHVGVIGCGRLGSHLVHCLLSFAEVDPGEITIATRRPETLTELQEKGVTCTSQAREAAVRAHLLFICVLPAQFPAVAECLRGNLQPGCIVYSLMAALPVSRMRQLLEYSNVIRPEYSWGDRDRDWDHSQDITSAFTHRHTLRTTCPLYNIKAECVVQTDEKFVEQMIYAFVNMCTELKLPRHDTIDVVNAVILGHTTRQAPEVSLQQKDITRYTPKNTDLFPYFDLSNTVNRDTPLTATLRDNDSIREAFLTRYCFLFQQYLDWQNTALQQARKQIHFSFD